VQITLWDSDEGRLLGRLEAVLKRFPRAPETEAAQELPEGWCHRHGVQMTRGKDSKHFHKVGVKADGKAVWCRGKYPEPGSPTVGLSIFVEENGMGVKVRHKDGKWYVFINHQGKRKAKCVGDSKRAAEEVKRKLEAKLTLGEVGMLDAAPPRNHVCRLCRTMARRLCRYHLQTLLGKSRPEYCTQQSPAHVWDAGAWEHHAITGEGICGPTPSALHPKAR
jgi:hypothetical protein